MKRTFKIFLLTALVCMGFIRANAQALDDPRVFDANYYLNKYPDLRAAFQTDLGKARQHWLIYGINEGRQASPNFNPPYYLGLYPDLQKAFGNTNYAQAIRHWLQYGINEHRQGVAPSGNTAVVSNNTNTAKPSQLTPGDRNLVLKWIAEEAAAAKIEYCYRQSYGRGAGEPLSSCPGGSEKNGLLCYPNCESGYTGNGPVCWQNCPSGFSDDHATTCWKPVDYGRGAGRIPDVTCPASHPNKQGVGAAAWCDNGPRADFWNLSTAKAVTSCRGDEEWNGGLCYPKCRAGYQAAGCCLCSTVCPPGMSNSGAGCIKKSYGRGAGSPMGCRDGLEQDAALCYPKCRSGFHGVGPVCWQDCGNYQNVPCAAGCATSQQVCADKTINMITTPIQLAANILSFGETSEVTAAQTELKVALKARNLAGAKVALKATARGYAKGFEKLTSKKVAKKLKEDFEENAAEWIKDQYSSTLVKVSMGDSFSEEDLRDLAGLDPTGVAQVVEAFTQKICPGDHPFPQLSRSYK